MGEVGQIEWGDLIGVLNTTELTRTQIPNKSFMVEVGAGTECPLNCLRRNALDMLVYQCSADTQQETLPEIVAASQTRILLAIENKMSLSTVLQDLEATLKRTLL